jgi:hypothetical protein
MANELRVTGTPGATIYGPIVNVSGQFWNPSNSPPSFEVYGTNGDYTVYGISASEAGGSNTSGLFLGNFPSGIPAGVYWWLPRVQISASGPADGDPWAGQAQKINWDSAHESFPISSSAADVTAAAMSGSNFSANVAQIAGQTANAASAVTFPAAVGTSTLTQSQVTGGAYALNTDSAGNVKVSSGTGANQLNISGGQVASNVTQIAGQTANATSPVTFPASIGTSTLSQSQVTGGAYALNTDSAGNVKVSSGTGANQVNLNGGSVSVNVTQIAGQTASAAAPVTFPANIGTSTLTQSQITGGAYALNTDASGNVKISSGSGPNQLSLSAGVATANVLQWNGSAVSLSGGLPNVQSNEFVSSGPIAINQDTGGTDNLRYVDNLGNGVEGADILIYLATDWPGNPSQVQAAAVTGPDGRWLAPAFVQSGTYVAVFDKPGVDGPDVSPAFTI